MGRFLLTLFVFVSLWHGAAGQKIPKGYKLLEGAPASVSATADLDGDGKADLFCAVVKNGEEEARLLAQMSSGKVLISGNLSMCCASITVLKNGVVDVHSTGMRSFTYYKFRWDKTAGDFRMIGFDTENFGNATNDGSGKSSLNLLTGDYEASFFSWNEKKQKLIGLPKVKRRLAISKKIYLKSFNASADQWLSELDYNNLPKEVR